MSMLTEKWANDAIDEYRENDPEEWERLAKMFDEENELRYTALLIKARKDKNQILAIQIKQEAHKAGIILH